MQKENFKFLVNGIEIKGDTLFQVTPKPDLNAPDAFIQHETSKLLMGGVEENAPCLFDEKKKVWDTGFYTASPCYIGRPADDVKALVDLLQEHIVKPYEQMHGEGSLDHKQTNNEFWDKFGGRLYNGRVINTNNVEDLLELYIAILHYHTVRPEDKSKHFAMKASYCIINKEAAVSLREKKQLEKAEAVGGFYALLHSAKEELLNIMEWLAIIATRETDNSIITSLMMSFLEDEKMGANNVKRFNEAKKQNNYPKGKEEFAVFAGLRNLRRKRIITEEYQQLNLDGIELGSNLKDATARVMADKELKIKVAEALENETAK